MKKETIVFNEAEHTYTLITEQGEIELTPITKFMQVMNISPNYDGIPQEVLNKAAEHGKIIHSQLENFIKHHDIGLSNAVDDFQFAIAKKNYTPLHSEIIVYNHLLAGTIDCVFRNDKNELILCDFKTTSKLHTTSVAWQLSLYAHLWNESHKEKISGIEAWHFDKNKDDHLTIHELTLVEPKEVKKVIKCFETGEAYKPTVLKEELLKSLVDFEEKKAELQQQIKDIEIKEEAVRNEIVDTLKSHNYDNFKNDKISITIVAGGTRKVFDKTKFEKDHADLYNSYMKESKTKESIRINLVDKDK